VNIGTQPRVHPCARQVVTLHPARLASNSISS